MKYIFVCETSLDLCYVKFNNRPRRWGWDVHPPYPDFCINDNSAPNGHKHRKKAKGPQNGSLTIPKFGSVNNY